MSAHVPDPRSTRLLIAGYVVVVSSFLAAVLFTQSHIQSIDVASDDIARNAMPTVKHLGDARQAVGELEVALLVHVGSAARVSPAARPAIEAPLRELAVHVDAYLALPLFPGERPLYDDVQRATHALVNAVDRMLGQLEARNLDVARATYLEEVTPATADLHGALSRDIEFNADNGSRVAERIKAIRVRGEWIGISLAVLCAVVAVLAGVIVNGQIRRHETLAAEHLRLLEERAGELDHFSRRVAHDIMNPSAAAQLAIELEVRRQRAAGAVPSESLQRAQRSLKSIQALVDALLGFARAAARPAPGEAADVVEAVEDVLCSARPRAAHARQALTAELVPGAVACARGVLISLVGNLVDNAIKYSGDDGRILVRSSSDAGTVRVEVQDSGPGLAPELGDRAFEPYVRGAGSDKPGLGLGLATVKRLAESHGGRVGVRSSPGLGTTFWFELPRAAAAPARPTVSDPVHGAV